MIPTARFLSSAASHVLSNSLLPLRTLARIGVTACACLLLLPAVFGRAQSVQFSMEASAVRRDTALSLQTGAVDLGSVNICPAGQAAPAPCSRIQTLTYKIKAATILAGPSIVTQGAANLDFQLMSTTCAGPQTQGAECEVMVNFAPLAPGVRQGAVLLKDTSGALQMSTLIYGLGESPAIAFSSPGSQVAIGSGLTDPQGVATDASGNVFIADTGNNRVVEVARNGNPQTVVGSGLNYPYGVAMDGAGDLLIADAGNDRVVKVSAAGLPQTTVGSGLSFPQGVAVDGVGNIFIADTLNRRVVKMPAANGGQETLYVKGLGTPTGVAVDAGGDIIIADPENNRVIEVPAAGGAEITLGTGLNSPTGVAVDAAGDVFIADSGNDRIVEVPADGSSQFTFGDGLRSPRGAAVDPRGNVFVADSLNNQAIEVNRSVPLAINFAPNQLPTGGSSYSKDSPQALQLQNIGNQPLAAISPGVVLEGGTSFTLGDTSCSNNFVLSAGASCGMEISFYYGTDTAPDARIVLADNALNANPATQTVSITNNAASTTPTIIFKGSLPYFYYGEAVVMPTATSNSPAPFRFSAHGAYSFGYGTIVPYIPNGVVTFSVEQAASGRFTDGYASIKGTVVPAPTASQLTATAVANASGIVVTLSAETVQHSTLVGIFGTFSFYDGSTLLAQVRLASDSGGLPATSFTTGPLSSGAHLFTATFNPSQPGTFNSSTSNPVPINISGTTLSLQVPSATLTYPRTLAFEVKITEAARKDPSGTLSLLDGETLVGSYLLHGQERGLISGHIATPLNAGTHWLTAVYSGDGNNPSGASNVVSVTVNPAAVQLRVVCGNTKLEVGQPLNCKVNATAGAQPAPGTVTYTVDAPSGDATVAATLNPHGEAAVQAPNLSPGLHSIRVMYAAQGNYQVAAPVSIDFSVD